MTAQAFAELFATISRPLTAADGIPEAEIAAAEQRLGVRLPEPLRAYHQVAGNHRLNRVYDNLTRPQNWWIDRRMLVFLTENQCVVRWGVRATNARRVNPAVYYSVADGEGGRSEWEQEDLRCADFLTLMVCWQAVNGGVRPCGWGQVSKATGDKVAARFGMFRSRDLCAGYRPGQVVCVTGLGKELDVWAAGRTAEEFAALREELATLGVELEVP